MDVETDGLVMKFRATGLLLTSPPFNIKQGPPGQLILADGNPTGALSEPSTLNPTP